MTARKRKLDVATLEWVDAWCARQEKALLAERSRVPGSTLWPLECDSRRAQMLKTRRALYRQLRKLARDARKVK